MLDNLICILIKFVNFFTESVHNWFISVLIFFIEFLPPSPFRFEPIQWGEVGNLIGYFIPVAGMLTSLVYITTAVTVWYSIQHILRLLKSVR